MLHLYSVRILVLDTLNFSFWTPNPDQKFVVSYKGKTYTGYWSLVAAIDRALDVNMLLQSDLVILIAVHYK